MRNPLNRHDNSEDIPPIKRWIALELMKQDLEYKEDIKEQHSLEQGQYSFIGKGRIVDVVLALALTFCLGLVSPVALMLFVILLLGVVLSPLCNDQS